MKKMRLFRYLDAQGAVATIEQKALRISRLHDLNDPFEWRMGVANLIEGVAHLAEAATESVLRHQSSSIGVICFSAVPDESVLWSHYADRHRGMVFEIEVTEDPEKIIKIEYTDERPHFLAGSIGDENHMRPEIDRMIRRKSTGWAYEQEYRLYESLEDSDVRGGHYFKPLESHELKRVIVGWMCDVDVPYVQRALSQSGFSNTSVARAEAQSKTYKIKC